MYCDTRNYHYVLSAFWGTVALIWLWDLFTGYTPFERNPKYYAGRSALRDALPIPAPFVGARHGVPDDDDHSNACSVAAFTIGLLLLFAHKVNMFLVLFLCHWSLIGLSKTYFFQIPEDFLLASATIPRPVSFL